MLFRLISRPRGAFVILVASAATFSACTSPGGMYGHIGIHTAPPKPARTSNTQLATDARNLFWSAFAAADYDQLPEVLRVLTAAYLEQPRDPQIALLLAHAHFWRISERARSKDIESDPRITDSLVLARHNFNEAAGLNPKDGRIPGWLGAVQMAAGTVNADQREIRTGYFVVRDAWKAWPEFNGFTFAYAMSNVAVDDEMYPEVVAAVWSNVDACIDGRIDRKNPDVTRYAEKVPHDGRNAPCWNSEKAPHNQEGFWLATGDILLKSGDTAAAQHFYENARAVPGFSQWRYREEIETRLTSPDAVRQSLADGSRPMLVNSAISCVVCHAR